MFRKIVSTFCLMVALVTINSFSMEISDLLNEKNQEVIDSKELFQENEKAVFFQQKELDRAKFLSMCSQIGHTVNRDLMYVCPLCKHKPFKLEWRFIQHVEKQHEKTIK